MNAAELRFDKWFVHLATLGPIGRVAKAPGTWGSLPGLLLAFGISQTLANSGTVGVIIKSILIVLITTLAFFAIKKTEDYWQLHDRKEIVIDELAGQLIPTVFFCDHWVLILFSFVCFRIFDILKPGPIRYIDENWPGAAGTLFDDTLAGLCALACTAILAHFIL